MRNFKMTLGMIGLTMAFVGCGDDAKAKSGLGAQITPDSPVYFEANYFECSFDTTMQTEQLAIDLRETKPTMELVRSPEVVPLGNAMMNDTLIGRVVAGFYPYIADASLVYGVILPHVSLTSKDNEADFETTILTSFSGGYYPHPRPYTDHVSGRTTPKQASCVGSHREVVRKYTNVIVTYSEDRMPSPYPNPGEPVPYPVKLPRVTVTFDAVVGCETKNDFKASIEQNLGRQSLVIEQTREDSCRIRKTPKTFTVVASGSPLDLSKDLYLNGDKVEVVENITY